MIRKTSTLFVISLVAAIALCLPALTYALTGGNAEQNGSQCPMNQFFYKFFNITPEQQAALEKVRQDTDAQIKPYMDQIKPLEDQLQAK